MFEKRKYFKRTVFVCIVIFLVIVFCSFAPVATKAATVEDLLSRYAAASSTGAKDQAFNSARS